MSRFVQRIPFLIVVVSLLSGCGLFQTREPESPTQPSDSFPPASVPDVVIENLQGAIEKKDAVNYARCFPASGRERQPYVFIPASGASALFSGVFARWSVDEERQYFQNMVAQTSTGAISALQISNKSILESADSALYSFNYVLVFQHTGTTLPDTAMGTMQLVLGLDLSNMWVIYRWTDFRTTTDYTWSYFKGKFSN